MIDAAELKSIFEKEYNRTDWLHALREIFQIRNLHEVPQGVDLPVNDFDARAMEMGFFETSEGLLIGIFEVTITPNIPLERHKVGLRNMMRNVYKRDMDAALIVFTQGSSWRFSYASELTVANKDTGKREKRQTDPKRYTYLLGTGQHCRTAAERFAKLKSTTDLFDTKVSISEIEKAFSVDILTKDFYRELSNWYFWALNHVTFPDDDEPNDEARNPSNLIRLITRLIFVWFLKQKGLVPDSLFDKEKIWPHLNFGYETESNYYKAILQNLFFATLNQEMNKRSFRRNGQHYNITNLYRYRKLFKKPDETIELFKNIPFLNGGLFECLDKPHPTEKTPQGNEKIVRIDGFSDHDNNPLQIPDYLFFGGADAVDLSQVYDDNRQKNVHVRGIIEILNSYNFTVEENTPLEIQVALDPELLGKVFENLLASYNPETKTTARKQTGSFYTPREIVNYMVDESLMAYLKQKLADESSGSEEEMESKLRELVSYSGNGNPFDETETQSIVKAIDHIKVLDPACGSGAFPMGILQQLVHVLQKLDPDNKLWKQLQMQRAQEEIQEAIAAGDTANFAERLKEIADAFENNAEDYGRKLYLIENCIYGVDIQPIAVQIAKLRFFISLLVDQTIKPNKDNIGIRALPNLETKFVAANTLIGLETKMTLKPNKVYQLEAELENVRRRHFRAIKPEKKRYWRKRDGELRNEIAIELINAGFPETDADQISNWDPYNQNTYSEYFDKYWMFGVEDGFDIVIGNPPYISYYSNTGSSLSEYEKEHFVRNYKSVLKANDRINSMNLMTEKGLFLLNDNGHLSFITNKTISVLPSYKEVRKFILNSSIINYLVTDLDPFDAIVDCVVLGLSKKVKSEYYVRWLKGGIGEYQVKSISPVFNNAKLEFHFSSFHSILSKIEKAKNKIEDLLVINRGVNIGGCFNYFLNPIKESKFFWKYLSGTKNINKYSYEWHESDGYMKFDQDIEKSLREQGATLVLGNHDRYKQERLFIPESGQHVMAAYCDDDYYSAYGIMVATSANPNYSIKYACALLNSRLFTFYAVEKEILRKGKKATPHIGVKGLNSIPVHLCEREAVSKFTCLVDEILKAKKSDSNANTLHFENQIDELVYKLYNLTYAEVKIIDPDFWLGEEEYENIKLNG